jgi:hypothetical protein
VHAARIDDIQTGGRRSASNVAVTSLARITLTILLLAAVAACGNATGPSEALAVTFAVPVAARRVACPACTVEPREWAVAEFPVTIADASNRGGTVASVEARVTNRSRGIELGRGVRPNSDYAYPDTRLPAGGALVAEAGVVFFPVPPAGDDVWIDVIVTLTDGRVARHSGSVAIPQ